MNCPPKNSTSARPLRRLQMKSKLHLGFADLFGETRWLGELISFTLHGPFRRTNPSARSHGRGVLLIPGFLSGDYSLNPLGARLAALGYRIFFSGIWYNVDCPVHTLPRLEKVLRKANYKTHAKVVLIGHSLGGIYARELACRFPHLAPPRTAAAILLGLLRLSHLRRINTVAIFSSDRNLSDDIIQWCT